MTMRILSLVLLFCALLAPDANAQDELVWQPTALYDGTSAAAVAAVDGVVFAQSGALYRTEDERVWRRVHERPVWKMIQYDTGLLAAGMDSTLYRSDDLGLSWNPIAEFPHSPRDLIEVNGVLFAATTGGVFRSDDGGNGWLPWGLSGKAILSLATSAANLFASDSFAVYRSGIAMPEWEQVRSGLEYFRVSVNPISGRLHAPGGNDHWFFSDDDGVTWDSTGVMHGYLGSTFAFTADGSIFVARGDLQIFRSNDDGGSWENAGGAVWATWIAISQDGTVYYGTWGGGWRPPGGVWRLGSGRIGPPAWLVPHLAAGPDGSVYATTTTNLRYTTDQGANWTGPGVQSTPFGLHFSDDGVRYYGGMYPQGSEMWVRRFPDGTSQVLTEIAGYQEVVTTSDEIILAAPASAPGTWLRSVDGEVFEAVFEGPPANAAARDALGYLYFGTDEGAFRSTDDGLTWHPIGPEEAAITAFDRAPDGSFYAGTAGSGVYRVVGDEWMAIGLESHLVRGLAGANGSVFATTPEGVFQYSDAVGWEPVNEGLSGLDVRRIVLDPAGYLYVTVQGDGVYRSESPLPVTVESGPLVKGLSLEGPFPHPVVGRAQVSFVLAEAGRARLVVYDLLGREVVRLVDAHRAAGSYTEWFDAARLPAGMYVMQLRVAGETAARKVMVIPAAR